MHELVHRTLSAILREISSSSEVSGGLENLSLPSRAQRAQKLSVRRLRIVAAALHSRWREVEVWDPSFCKQWNARRLQCLRYPEKRAVFAGILKMKMIPIKIPITKLSLRKFCHISKKLLIVVLLPHGIQIQFQILFMSIALQWRTQQCKSYLVENLNSKLQQNNFHSLWTHCR